MVYTNTLPKSRLSIWELTADYTTSLDSTHIDSISSTPIFEAADHIDATSFVLVDELIFNSCIGPRRVNGQLFHGPIYNIDTHIIYDGPRFCPCSICESSILPMHRKC